MNNEDTVHDDVLGELRWSSDCWVGATKRFGAELPLAIEFDYYDPSDEERHKAIQQGRDVFVRLDESWERKAREDAAREVTEAAYCQSEYTSTDEDVRQLLEDMRLESLGLIYSDEEETVFPCLSYASPKFFPAMSIDIQFSTDLDVEEVTVNEKPTQ